MPETTNARLTATFSLLFALLVALLFPVGYFVISYQYATGSLQAEAEINSQIIAGVVQGNPELWRFEHERLEALLSRRTHEGCTETRRILDPTGAEVAVSGDQLEAPVISRSQPLLDDGKVAATVEISRSLLPLLRQTALVALAGLGLGVLVFLLLPFRALGRANAELKDSYGFLSRVMEGSTNAIIVLDLDGKIAMFNGRCAEMSGYSREELKGASIGMLFADYAVDELFAAVEKVTSGSVEVVKFETELLARNGTPVSIACGTAPIHQKGRLAGTVLCLEDVMQRRQAVEELRQAKEYTEKLIQAANVIIIGLDLSGAVTLFNRTAEEVTGYRATELTDRDVFRDVMGAESFGRMCAAGDLVASRASFESEIVTKSGTKRTISWRNSPIVQEERVVGTLCFGIDITEHRKTEAQLRQSQKMESLGQLAGGVAHDFNNMLSVILGYAQLCLLDAQGGSTLQQYLLEVMKAGERSRDMVRQLLAFSRKEIISPREVHLNAHCQEAEKTLSRLIGEEVTLSFLPAASLWPVKIDPHQADQILINLAVNARDAMPAGGELLIMTENAVIGEGYSNYHLDAHPGEYTCLTVKDSGTGMDGEVVKHIFEPFFTTKEIGKGTGLGLATVYGIVTQNGGFIDVESAPGMGTAFKIYLPRLLQETAAGVSDRPAPPAGSGTILVVEDDDSMRSMTTAMLQRVGYLVIPAANPQRALAICREREVDLVLSDVIMPGMNGREMARGISRLRPDTKVLFMSGYSSEIVAKRGVLEEGTHYIQKPFDLEGLHAKISELRALGT